LVTHHPDITRFAERLRAAHGGGLVAVVLYGNAASNDAAAGATGYRTLVVLRHVLPADLRAASDPVAEWVDAGHIAPVYFSEEEIANAADVFPIEFLDMMDHRVVVDGRDPFEGLDVSTRHLRHQVEFELRGKLIRLRELYMPAAASPERLTALLVDSLGTFAKLFRFALRVAGGPELLGRREALRAAVRHFALDDAPFARILAALDSGRPMQEADAHECFGVYLEQIQRVIDAVDRIPED
jgi:hypothetical protein